MATSLFLSLELMYLLKWLIKHDKTRLRVLINHALKHGLGRQMHEYAVAPQGQPKNTDEMLNDTFLELLNFMEGALMEGLENQKYDDRLHGKLTHVLSHMNVEGVDDKTLSESLHEARHELKHVEEHAHRSASGAVTKQVLTRKMLKNWKPGKDDSVN